MFGGKTVGFFYTLPKEVLTIRAQSIGGDSAAHQISSLKADNFDSSSGLNLLLAMGSISNPARASPRPNIMQAFTEGCREIIPS